MTDEQVLSLGDHVRRELLYFLRDPRCQTRQIAFRPEVPLAHFEVEPEFDVEWALVVLDRPKILDVRDVGPGAEGMLVKAAWGVLFASALQQVCRFEAAHPPRGERSAEERIGALAEWCAGQFGADDEPATED